MTKTTCKKAGTPKACPKNAKELFYLCHPKVVKALSGPFLTEADAEAGVVMMRSADAVVTACLVDSIDDITYLHALNNRRVCRAFAGADRHGGARHD
jgi:Iap family predicted aminopeptidase